MMKHEHRISYGKRSQAFSCARLLLPEQWRLVKPLLETPLAQLWQAEAIDGDPVLVLLPQLPSTPPLRRLRLHVALMDAAQRAQRHPHPNLLTPIAVGLSPEEEIFVVLPLPEAPTLACYLQQHGPMEPRRAIACTLELLEGLEALHCDGQTHRNLHPGAALIPEHGPCQLVHVGLGAAMDGGGSLSNLGRFYRGDPRFLTPEYALQGATARSADLFQLALLLASMLLGAPPIQEKTVYAVLRRLQHQDSLIPAALRDLPVIGPLLQRALQLEPRRRFATAPELREALQSALAALEEPERHDPPPPSEHTRSVETLALTLQHLRERLPSQPLLTHHPAAPAEPPRAHIGSRAATLTRQSATHRRTLLRGR